MNVSGMLGAIVHSVTVCSRFDFVVFGSFFCRAQILHDFVEIVGCRQFLPSKGFFRAVFP